VNRHVSTTHAQNQSGQSNRTEIAIALSADTVAVAGQS